MIGTLMNSMRQHSGTDSTGPRAGIISGYDQVNGCVKVVLQPEGRETNWIQLDSPGVGNGWGVQIGPQIGDEVTVAFESGDPNQGRVVSRHTNTQDRPLPVPSGEIWAVHSTGSLLKFNTDGTVTLHSGVALNYDAPAHHFTGGPVSMDHTLTVTGGDVMADTISLKNHHTSGVTPGSGTSGTPTP